MTPDEELDVLVRLAEAERRIEQSMAAMRDSLASYAQAVAEEDWKALGYPSLAAWTRYVLAFLYEAPPASLRRSPPSCAAWPGGAGMRRRACGGRRRRVCRPGSCRD